MKNYKKGLLTLMVLSSMSLLAAEDLTIYVNTFDDEDGENTDKCSLREAVTAASLHQAYGGCNKGESYPSNTNVIQLEAGTYTLNKELKPNAALIVYGKTPADYTRADMITNTYPAKTALQTTILGSGSHRLFNTTELDRPALSLRNLILKNGQSDRAGGSLFVGGSTQLSNVWIDHSSASQGGAIYLNDKGSHLTVEASVFSQNKASKGSVLAMSCIDNLDYTPRTISFSRSSFIQNGTADSQSMLAFCGEPDVTMTANTISDNTANSSQGQIIQFSSMQDNSNANLSATSSLQMISNTIVKNAARAVLLYNGTGSKALSFNVIGFNDGKACAYNDGDVSTVDVAQIGMNFNAIHLSSADVCELPTETIKAMGKSVIELDGKSFSNLFSNLQQNQEYTAFLPMYFPIDHGTADDLVDVSSNGCSEVDQRNISRVDDSSNSTSNYSCDVGSTEILKLTANELKLVNSSVVTMLAEYQKQADAFKALIDNKDTKTEFLPFYNLRYNEYLNLIKYTKSDQKYRTIFIDPFAGNLPDETVLADGARQIRPLNIDNYNVNVETIGVGKIDSTNSFVGSVDRNLKCEWNANLKRILMYRTDDRVTPSGDNEICRYTLSSKNSTPATSSTAYIQSSFVNIAPIVPAGYDINVQHGGNQKVSVDLLKAANDDGDGSVVALTSNPNKSAFYLNDKGQSQAIRFSKLPDAVSVVAERSGACPNLDKKYTCYGGEISLQLNNTLDVFDYNVEYAVYDADGTISNTGILSLKNSATASGSSRTSGGGAMGWISLMGLFGLAIWRKRKVTA